MLKTLRFSTFLFCSILFSSLTVYGSARLLSEIEAIQQQMTNIQPWFHTIELGDGLVTPGICKLKDELLRSDIYFSMGIEGFSVLDVAAWDGFYSFEAEKRGASRVMAVDKYCWGGGGSGNRLAFEFAKQVLGSRVEDRILDIPETTVENLGQFDVVLFNGIVYHIKDPFHALANMAKITRYVLTVETFVDKVEDPRPVAVFYPGENTTPGYPKNGWGFNPLAMVAYLKSLGFETVLEFIADNPNRRIFLAFKPGHPFKEYIVNYSGYIR